MVWIDAVVVGLLPLFGIDKEVKTVYYLKMVMPLIIKKVHSPHLRTSV